MEIVAHMLLPLSLLTSARDWLSTSRSLHMLNARMAQKQTSMLNLVQVVSIHFRLVYYKPWQMCSSAAVNDFFALRTTEPKAPSLCSDFPVGFGLGYALAWQ
ncbi:hypothetical protein KC19_3G203700 [Ceratodon purpureus]|uniref:Uncharacterized protein n=1 Tax=Ceratodon purpureus TaxID=3225 RepID=A0A8T0IM50_CERPU|nr:hypothetical protein KC19_3G203700 [Ceratodon purpureus]